MSKTKNPIRLLIGQDLFLIPNLNFGKKIKSKSISETLELFDEVMTTIQVINPPMYASVLRKI